MAKKKVYLWLDGRVRRWKEISKKEWQQKLKSGKFPASHFAETTILPKKHRNVRQ